MYQAHKKITGTRHERIRECHRAIPKPATGRNLFRLDSDGVTVRSAEPFEGAEPLCVPENGTRVVARVLYIPKRNGKRFDQKKMARNSRIDVEPKVWLDRALRAISPALSVDSVDCQWVEHGRYEKGLSRAVDVSVTGQVSSSTALAEIMASGIGDHRSYGCGMLVVEAC